MRDNRRDLEYLQGLHNTVRLPLYPIFFAEDLVVESSHEALKTTPP